MQNHLQEILDLNARIQRVGNSSPPPPKPKKPDLSDDVIEQIGKMFGVDLDRGSK
jgi:hypothetical protein